MTSLKLFYDENHFTSKQTEHKISKTVSTFIYHKTRCEIKNKNHLINALTNKDDKAIEWR
jgi:hypothetical protein